MEHICEKISQGFADYLNVICNDDKAKKLVLRIRTVDQSKTQNEENLPEDSTRMDDDTFLPCLESPMLSDLTSEEIEDISKVDMVNSELDQLKKRVQVNDDGEIEGIAHWMSETDRTSSEKVLATKDVDSRRTYTFSFDASYVNHRHWSLLRDVMTSKGHRMAIHRHGINRQDVRPMIRCSFEETVHVLMEGAADHFFLDVEKCSSAMELQITFPSNSFSSMIRDEGKLLFD